jgi:hypothetical protein
MPQEAKGLVARYIEAYHNPQGEVEKVKSRIEHNFSNYMRNYASEREAWGELISHSYFTVKDLLPHERQLISLFITLQTSPIDELYQVNELNIFNMIEKSLNKQALTPEQKKKLEKIRADAKKKSGGADKTNVKSESSRLDETMRQMTEQTQRRADSIETRADDLIGNLSSREDMMNAAMNTASTPEQLAALENTLVSDYAQTQRAVGDLETQLKSLSG